VDVLVAPPSVQRKQSIDVEAELVETFIGNHLLSEEGWPFAEVMDCAPVNHEAYAAAASALTRASLVPEVLARCRAAAYDPSPGRVRFLEKQFACARDKLAERLPVAYSYDYFLLPLVLMHLHLHEPETSRADLRKRGEGMTHVAEMFERLAQIASLVNLRCRSDAATWILASKVILLGGDFDTIGVREYPDRRLRTRLEPEEVARLGWRRR